MQAYITGFGRSPTGSLDFLLAAYFNPARQSPARGRRESFLSGTFEMNLAVPGAIYRYDKNPFQTVANSVGNPQNGLCCELQPSPLVI
jgi:hypothetical protein